MQDQQQPKLILRSDSNGATHKLRYQLISEEEELHKPNQEEEFGDEFDSGIVDEEEGITKERVNNFSNKNLISAPHIQTETLMNTRGSVAKDRNF
jgi:hypothetical protein